VGRSGVLSRYGNLRHFLLSWDPLTTTTTPLPPFHTLHEGGRAWISRESASSRNKPLLRHQSSRATAARLTRRIEGPTTPLVIFRACAGPASAPSPEHDWAQKGLGRGSCGLDSSSHENMPGRRWLLRRASPGRTRTGGGNEPIVKWL
jgi:hypothetical protein